MKTKKPTNTISFKEREDAQRTNQKGTGKIEVNNNLLFKMIREAIWCRKWAEGNASNS